MSLLKKLAGLAVGAAAVGAVAYVLQNREHHDDEYEHIWGPEDEWSWVMLRYPARRTARSTPPRSLTPLWPAIGRSRAARADTPNAQGASLF